MVEEPFTKDVFRELDGFLVVVSMLSTLALPEYEEGQEQDTTERLEASRVAFAIISEAMRDHPLNVDYFQVSEICSASNSIAYSFYFYSVK